jgi:thiol:disulfide interchange protein
MGGTSVGLPRVGVGVGNSLKTFARRWGAGGFLCALGRALVLLFIGISSFAANESHVRVSLLAEVSAVSPGEPFWVAVRLEHDPGWHTYYKEPGDSGLPTKIIWVLPEGFSAGPIRWPVPQRIELPPLVNYGYEGEAALLVLITPPAQIAGETVPLSAQVRWLECQEACVPGQADVSLSLPVSESPVEPSIEMALFFGEARALLEKEPKPLAGAAAPPGGLNLWVAVLLAFLGGMLLNLMPCVLPVLSIKFLGFLDTPRETLRQHGLLYGVGVLVSFWALAGVLIFLRAGGEKLGWGFQLQSPIFVGILAVLFFTLALNLMGVFEIGTSLVGLGGLVGGKSSANAFLSGTLAVLVATPCTAPFMGPALGYALTQSAGVSLATFSALGGGMAFPYVLLSFYPGGLRWIPKPGAWMITLKQGMAFLFFATCLWMVWVLGLQGGVGVVIKILLVFLGVGVGAWLAGAVAERSKSDRARAGLRWAGALIGVLSVLGIFSFRTEVHATGSVEEAFSQERVEALLAEGKPVFVDFTAAWCITCQVNEKTTLSTQKVQIAFREKNVAFLVADWTNSDPKITHALELFGRDGVPLYILYVPGQEPRILPTILTPDIVVDALKMIDQGSSS